MEVAIIALFAGLAACVPVQYLSYVLKLIEEYAFILKGDAQ